MGPRRTATAARASGQDPESPRHAAASTSERAENPEDGHSRLVELETKVSSLESEITVLNSELDECRHVIQEMAGVFGNDSIADMRRDMEQMSIQIGLLQRAVGSTPMVAHDPGARLRIPEPKAYSGERDAKEVENFLFDMEQYFLAADVRDEARKVATATMYLTGDAKLWWRTKFAKSRHIKYSSIRGLFYGRRSESSSSPRMWSTMPGGHCESLNIQVPCGNMSKLSQR